MSADRPVSAAPDAVTDDMVRAYCAAHDAYFAGPPPEDNDPDSGVRAGLEAVVPLIRAQVAAEHQCVTFVEEGPPAFILEDHDLAAIGMYEPDEPVADVQTAFDAADKGVTSRPLLAPSTTRDPHATVPSEAFDPTHPDHDDWVRDTGRCFAEPPCAHHAPRETDRG